MRLREKVAIVTGSGRGIGKAYAMGLASEGAKLCIAELNPQTAEAVAQEIRHNGNEAIAVPTDVSVEESVLNMAHKTAEAFGGIDILVNTIVHRVRGKFLDITIEEFRRVLEVNVTSYYFLTQKVVPHMIERGGGSVIHISSQLGFVVIPEYSPYCTSKGAVVNMTRALAFELADRNIRVNSVAPGPTDTPGINRGFQEDPQRLENLLADVPMGRMGRPEEIAEVCLFLAGDASSYVTGHNLVADGGYLAH